ncbi:Clp protease N-terminal domain-containing protein [Streptomyces sp. H10-C2]|uniref:Clp protease N-terminal domain-containing protein n=1 Tax=unclassified Streptomyces TaxID=2593676 RepID=UPI0024B91C9C|nr:MULTISPECIES: Clp protease N-terminal domain-containing protein [unclassified Streptomyces]MDJ0343103.1 Clp protease N-terminal domain-containing protein [Streptomyces sp. PH10-H1]MDJ0372717.1 Clp protease N-terminal domain-containing protein [Streptomyces sp. H10-C2]
MHSEARPLDLTHLDDDARLTVELRTVAAGARRRAGRDGDRQIDTAHLLHSLLETDPRARAVCDAGSGQVARVLGYLVQRSIGYGMEWRGSVEDSGALPVIAGRAAPGWSPSAAAAMRTAVLAAQRRGRIQADGVDLLTALAADPESRAVEVLRTAGLDVSRYLDEGPVAS